MKDEKNKIISGWVIVIAIIIAILVSNIDLDFKKEEKNNINEYKSGRLFKGEDVSSLNKITCKYPQVLFSSYIEDEISHELPKPESNPLIFTFSDFSENEQASLSFIDATQSITTVPIVKIIDTEEKFVFLELDSSYVTIHTIYKKSGISTYAKNIQLLGYPTATLSMGNCN